MKTPDIKMLYANYAISDDSIDDIIQELLTSGITCQTFQKPNTISASILDSAINLLLSRDFLTSLIAGLTGTGIIAALSYAVHKLTRKTKSVVSMTKQSRLQIRYGEDRLIIDRDFSEDTINSAISTFIQMENEKMQNSSTTTMFVSIDNVNEEVEIFSEMEYIRNIAAKKREPETK